MKILRNILLIGVLGLNLSFVPDKNEELYSLTINVNELQNSKGLVQFIIGVDGKIEELKVDIPNPDFHFTELEFKKLE